MEKIKNFELLAKINWVHVPQLDELVGIIKHDGHDFEIDHVVTDTWRYGQAGVDVVCIASNQKVVMIQKTFQPSTLDEIISSIVDVDLILTEGV